MCLFLHAVSNEEFSWGQGGLLAQWENPNHLPLQDSQID